MKHNFTIEPGQLPAMLAFVRVAHYGSFTRAAAELGVSPSALSQTIRALEARIGVRLLNRTTRRVGLTEVGTQFLARVQTGLDLIGTAFNELDEMRGKAAGTLRINLAQAAATLVVMPILDEFTRAYPDVKLELTVDDRFVDLIATGYDAGIRLGESLARDMVAIRASGEQRTIVVGAPKYFKRRTRPQTPADLHEHSCIRYRFSGSGGIYRWEFSRGGKDIEVDVDGPLVTNNAPLMIDAAVRGLGLAHVFEDSVRDELASGKLIAVLENWCPPFPGFYLYYPSRRQMPLKLRVFIDFLQQRLSASRR